MWNICRHRFAQNASYLLLTFKHYGRFDKRVPVFDYSKVEDSDPDVRHGLVCDFRILFFFSCQHWHSPFGFTSRYRLDWAGVRGWFDEYVQDEVENRLIGINIRSVTKYWCHSRAEALTIIKLKVPSRWSLFVVNHRWYPLLVIPLQSKERGNWMTTGMMLLNGILGETKSCRLMEKTRRSAPHFTFRINPVWLYNDVITHSL